MASIMTVTSTIFCCLFLHRAAGARVHVAVSTDTAVATLGGAEEPFSCVTMDWWPSNKCDYGVCGWEGASLLNADLDGVTQAGRRLRNALQTLAKSGGVTLRLGGTMADNITYSVDPSAATACPDFSPAMPTPSGNFTGGCLNSSRWAALHDLCGEGCGLVFGLNLMYGRSRAVVTPDAPCSGDWDPSNARALLEHTVARGLVVAGWELGNEIECLNASTYAEDVHTLRSIVDEVYGASSSSSSSSSSSAPPKIIVSDQLYWEPDFFQSFIPLVKDAVDVISWHDYPLGPGYNNPQLEANVMDPSFHDAFILSAKTASDTVASLGGKSMRSWRQQTKTTTAVEEGHDGRQESSATQKHGVWMGETGGCYNSGHYNVSNAFMDAFWYLESLAGFARNGATAFCRQTLLGGNYELVDKESLEPNPDFYALALFGKLMGEKVLDAAVVGSGGEAENIDEDSGGNVGVGGSTPLVRAWAQCSRVSDDNDGVVAGSVTVLLLNYGNSSVEAVVGASTAAEAVEAGAAEEGGHLGGDPPLVGQLYVMTGGDDAPDGLHSRTVKLNGQVLAMGSGAGDDPDAIPELEPLPLLLHAATVSSMDSSSSSSSSSLSRLQRNGFLVPLPPYSYAFAVVPPEAFHTGAAACT